MVKTKQVLTKPNIPPALYQRYSMVETGKAYLKLPVVAENPDKTAHLMIRLNWVKYCSMIPGYQKTGHNSCNSCHNLPSYGVDNLATSLVMQGNQVIGIPLPFLMLPCIICNSGMEGRLLWKNRPVCPILNPGEMAMPHKGFLVDRLKKDTMYSRVFTAAFPGESSPLSFYQCAKIHWSI